MAKSIVEYVIRLTDRVSPSLKKINANLSKTDAKMKRLDASISGLGVGLAGLAVGYGALKAINIAGEFEQAGIAFEVMLGSVEKGKKMMADLDKFATKTPFSIKGVQQNAKLLLAVGIEAENLIPTMRNLGNVSAGLDVPLERIALNYGQVMSAGKLAGTELKDFTRAGVPLLEVLGKMKGVSRGTIRQMSRMNQISFEDVKKAFELMSGKGGRFHDLMGRLNKTFIGQVNEMRENIQILARTIGQALIPIITPLVNLVAKLVGVMQRHKTAVEIWTKIAFVLIGVIALVVIAVKAWSIAQAIFAVIALASTFPITAIVLAIIVLIGIIAAVVTSIDGWGEQWKVLKNIFNLSLDLMKLHFTFIWKTITHTFMTSLDLMKIAWLKAKKVLGFGDSNQTEIDALTQGIKDRTRELITIAKEATSKAKELKNAFEWKLSFDKESPLDKAKEAFKKGGKILGVGGDTTQTQETKVTSSAPKVFNININKLVEQFNVNTENVKEAPSKVKDMIQQALLEALADIEIAR